MRFEEEICSKCILCFMVYLNIYINFNFNFVVKTKHLLNNITSRNLLKVKFEWIQTVSIFIFHYSIYMLLNVNVCNLSSFQRFM